MNVMIPREREREREAKAFGWFAKRQMLIKEAVGPSFRLFRGRISPFVMDGGVSGRGAWVLETRQQ